MGLTCLVLFGVGFNPHGLLFNTFCVGLELFGFWLYILSGLVQLDLDPFIKLLVCLTHTTHGYSFNAFK